MSVTREAFRKGIGVLCAAYNREPSDALVAVYADAVRGHFTDDSDWLGRVAEVVKTERWWPPPAVLLADRVRSPEQDKAAEQIRLEQEAVSMCRAVERCMVYNPHSGSYHSESDIRAKLGDRAADCFNAAGGRAVFGSLDERVLSFAQRDFVKAWVGSRKVEGAKRLQSATRGSLRGLNATESRRLVAKLEREVTGE
jgi:hypothetical protein